ncbi:MAG TPA: ATP-binding protein [Ktedonobacteraceae bacterium]|nr:ATP-binding protein [Ktedonobacteraceae bacterium]
MDNIFDQVKTAHDDKIEDSMETGEMTPRTGDLFEYQEVQLTRISHGNAPSRLKAEILAGGGEMGALMRSIDWSTTILGPVESWPQSLRTAVSICLASYFPMLIWWGPELVMLYNDAYRPMLGATKHPQAMGQKGRECWPEIWDIIGPMLGGVLTRGQATWSENQLLPLDRNGYVEECYFTFSYSPIRDETGGIGGVFTAVTETTQQVLGERRLRTLRELAASTAGAKADEEVCSIAARTISNNPADIPFALLYLLDTDGKQARLVCTAGLEDDTSIVPSTIYLTGLDKHAEQWHTIFKQVVQTGKAELIDRLDKFCGELKLLAHNSMLPEMRPSSAMVLSVTRPGQNTPYGLLITGISPMRMLDEEYRGFFELVAGQIATAIASARAYQEARERAEALAELDAAKTAFFSNVSHEFRTPLTLLLGPVEDALADNTHALPPEQKERLEIVWRNALRLLKLVNTLLDFSRIEAGRIQATYEPVDLAAYTRELASSFRSAIEKAGLYYEVFCPALPEPVYVDREMWEKIVLNLLSNALKFTLDGGIRVELRSVDEHVELEVSDTGVGVAPEALPHIFERFYRARDIRARTHEGSGIGLALVQELVQLHGGTVQVHSTVGKGTSFVVSIPKGKAHLPAERIETERTLQSTAVGAAPYIEEALRWLPGASGADKSAVGTINRPLRDDDSVGRAEDATRGVEDAVGRDEDATREAEDARQREVSRRESERQREMRVLLVDDNADMRDYLQHILSSRWTVEAVANGAAALKAIQQHLPDLVLSDVMMPGLDGFQLMQALRSNPRTRSIPIILLSARAGEESTVEGLEAGADDYLVKPFSARELLARVGTHLEMARLRQDAILAREELFSIVSHDLKNPVATIKGYAQLLRRVAQRLGPANVEKESQQLLSGLSRIDATASRMTALINELLDLTALHIGKPLELDKKETDLVALTHQMVATYAQTRGQHDFRIHAEVPQLVGYWDTTRLERVISNLISNAIKYSPDGSEVVIEMMREDDEATSWAVLKVRDQGIGIPAKDLPFIFDRFHRGSNVVGRIEGTGLGLASARQIIEHHGGTIEATSQEGAGSTFIVRLPLTSLDASN